MGEDVAELALETGIAIGIDIGSLELVPLVYEELPDWSRRYCMEGDTARRFELLGYGSKRSSTRGTQS